MGSPPAHSPSWRWRCPHRAAPPPSWRYARPHSSAAPTRNTPAAPARRRPACGTRARRGLPPHTRCGCRRLRASCVCRSRRTVARCRWRRCRQRPDSPCRWVRWTAGGCCECRGCGCPAAARRAAGWRRCLRPGNPWRRTGEKPPSPAPAPPRRCTRRRAYVRRCAPPWPGPRDGHNAASAWPGCCPCR